MHQPQLDVAALIDKSPIGPFQLRVVILCGLITLVDGYDLQAMALAVPVVAGDWRLALGDFGWMLAAALMGLAIGGVTLGPLGDRFGRRPVLIGGVMLVGLASLATAAVTNMWGLFVCRLLTGIGLGACMPNVVALVSDYAPVYARARLITLIGCGVSLGAFGGGMIASWFIDWAGWQGIFIAGGVATVALAGLLAAWLPESINFTLRRKMDRTGAAKLLARAGISIDPGHLALPQIHRLAKPSVSVILGAPYRRRTLLAMALWVLTSFTFFALVNWLPTLLIAAGQERSDALRNGGFVWLGVFAGGIALSWLFDRARRKAWPVGCFLAASALATVAFSALSSAPSTWGVLMVAIGGSLGGVQFVLPALAARLYPSEVLTTGVGWVSTVGRIGSMAGPIAGGWIVSASIGVPTVMLMLSIPVLAALAASSLLLAQRSSEPGLRRVLEPAREPLNR